MWPSIAKYRAWLIMLLVTQIMILGSCLVWAASFSADEIISPTMTLKNQAFPALDLTKTYKSRTVEKAEELDDIEAMMMALVYFESLEGYSIYNPKLRGTLPLEPVSRMLFVSAIRDPDYPLKMFLLDRPDDNWRAESGFRFIFGRPRLEKVRGLTYLTDTTGLRAPSMQFPRHESHFMDFLTEDTGLFSGKPWSWENVLPRLLTVAGFLIMGLLGTEVLRYVLGIGSRGRGRERS